MTLADIGPLYEGALPLLADRHLVFSQLLDSIAWCERLGSSAWAVTQLPDGFRLNVGQVEAMTCRFSFWHSDEPGSEEMATSVNLRLLLAGSDCPEKLALLGEAADVAEMPYASVGERHWCYAGVFEASTEGEPHASLVELAQQLNLIRDSHHAFLLLACRTPTGKLRQKSNFARTHCAALYDYAFSVVRGGAGKRSLAAGQASAPSVATAEKSELSPLEKVRLEKSGSDSGFDLPPTWAGSTVTFRSVQFPEAVMVRYLGSDAFVVDASSADVLPVGATAEGVRVEGWQALYEVLGKVCATARTLPDRVAQKFTKSTGALPKSTEAERWVVQRIGQDLFRSALLDFWRGKCCVTGLEVQGLLRASHIKPWSECDSDLQRLDVFNGLLLASHVDALFDGGWISFSDNGSVLVSPALPEDARQVMGVSAQWRVAGLMPAHAPYLAHHRQCVWRAKPT